MSDARTVIDRLTAAMNDHDPARAAQEYAEGVVVVAPEGTVEGREAATSYLEQFLTAFPDLEITAWSKVTSGETTLDEWSLTGTHTGPLALPDGGEVPPTGRQVTMRGCDVATVGVGRIVSHRLYYDQSELMTQLGLLSTGAGLGAGS